jgi:hypothetical protein
MKELQEIQKNLKKIIPFKWRVQSFSKFKAQATCVSYIDSRDVQDILDASCVWSDRYYSEGGLLFCEITIYADDREYKRTDTGSESNVDKQKGHSSDAFKRAAVKFGVGRFLYSQKMQYVTADAIKTNNNYPNVIDERGNKIWDLTKHINLKSKAPAATPTVTPATEINGRKIALKDSQFKAVILSKNKAHAKHFLDNFRMADDERTQLKAIL